MRKWIIPLFSLALLFTPAARATTLLTNAVPVTFILPSPTFAGQLSNGDLDYAIYVPPGATNLTIELDTPEPLFVSQLLVRLGNDVGFSGTGSFVYDFLSSSLSSPLPGTQIITITAQSNPALQSGTYYIGFRVWGAVQGTTFVPETPPLTLTATVTGGPITPIRTVAISTFNTDLDGWTPNSAATSLPGASQGNPGAFVTWQSGGGHPGGFAQLYRPNGMATDALLAPAKFLGNLGQLDSPRFEFDYLQLTGGGAATPVQIRIFSSQASFQWQGNIPPANGISIDASLCTQIVTDPLTGKQECVNESGGLVCSKLAYDNATRTYECAVVCTSAVYNSATGQYDCAKPWTHYVAALQPDQWKRLSGDAPFSQVLGDVERVEVITTLSPSGESDGIDNFALLSRGPGPVPTVLAGNTSFTSGADGWTSNYPAPSVAGTTLGNPGSTLRWVPFEGNPGGYLRLTSSGGSNRDFVEAPAQFLGNYGSITNPEFQFDYNHISGPPAALPVEVHLIGAQSVFVWTGPVPANTWTHYVVPLTASVWNRVSGTATLAQALAEVDAIEVSMQQDTSGTGPEANGLDNFWLTPGSLLAAPPAISANPLTISFSAVARGNNPAAQSISVTSIGGGVPLSFNAAAVGEGGNWLKISDNGGTTPRSLGVWADISGLAPGTYNGAVTVSATGVSLGPKKVPVTLVVSAESAPAPHLNSGGAVNAASNKTQLAPGALGTLYGTTLGPQGGAAAQFILGTNLLPTRLQGVRLLVEETYGALIAEAPLLYVSDSQINFQLPFETFGRSEVELVVDNNGSLSGPLPVQVVPIAPGIFTYGNNRAVVVNADNSVNAAGNGA
ncbi:MAG TPA: hypothetical protein VEU62_14125, partial [Bryobacterales bacterium]|nr:hypothetical protein [Bryobacterales bacterium]